MRLVFVWLALAFHAYSSEIDSSNPTPSPQNADIEPEETVILTVPSPVFLDLSSPKPEEHEPIHDTIIPELGCEFSMFLPDGTLDPHGMGHNEWLQSPESEVRTTEPELEPSIITTTYHDSTYQVTGSESSMFMPKGDLHACGVDGIVCAQIPVEEHVCINAYHVLYHFYKSSLPTNERIELNGGYAERCHAIQSDQWKRAELYVMSDCLDCVMKRRFYPINTWNDVLKPLHDCNCEIGLEDLCDRKFFYYHFETAEECVARAKRHYNLLGIAVASGYTQYVLPTELSKVTETTSHYGEFYLRNVRLDDPVFLEFVSNIRMYVDFMDTLRNIPSLLGTPYSLKKSRNKRRDEVKDCYRQVGKRFDQEDFPVYLNKSEFAVRFCGEEPPVRDPYSYWKEADIFIKTETG